MILRKTITALLAGSVMLLHTYADAAISLSRTRVIFDGKYKEASVAVRNAGGDILVQSWIDERDASNGGEVPFVVTPPLAKLGANQQQLLRIIYAGGNKMPVDRESVFWLNVQEVPESANADNVLQVAIRQRIKIFFRPAGLAGDPMKAPEALQWQLAAKNGKAALQVTNDGKYHVSMGAITLSAAGKTELVKDSTMVAPGETAYLPVTRFNPAAAATLKFESINDYGGKDAYAAQLNGNALAHAQPLPREMKS
ncbi:molecular chaperone [Achromobacter sp. NPDC058515]|uniref:fimbrial biogenesis chaperone n=1 Tax=Achromobacter sp. NPDC058515 TaxID=3346533 RepID=UPI0036679266